MSFRTKITAILILLMFFAGAVSNFLIYEYSLKIQMTQLRDKLMTIAQLVADNISADKLLKVPLSKNAVDTEEYKEIKKELMKIRDISPSIAYIYILERLKEGCIFNFVIDLHPGSGIENNPPAEPGEEYDCSFFPEITKAFYGPSADKKITKDKWGVFLSGYAPIKNDKGDAVAILGIDMSARDVYNMQREVLKRSIFVLILGIILSSFFGTLISGRVTRPIKKLVEGTRNISAGNLDYRVDVRSSGEINELAESFNNMALKLSTAHKELLNYFSRMVRSLVRSLEAKDLYTKGHSDRVAEYAVRIARNMGISEERIEILKEAALLHDIGKMGVQDIILHKKSELSDDERDEIRRHPAIGENILKPVSINEEMLAAVKQHHERYDGTGYPDKLKGDGINILAAIISAADAYDAMTSNRPYMKNMNKEEAIEQLRAKSGKQFNPSVINAFMKVLNKEV